MTYDSGNGTVGINANCEELDKHAAPIELLGSWSGMSSLVTIDAYCYELVARIPTAMDACSHSRGI